jgi:hypothetical protein
MEVIQFYQPLHLLVVVLVLFVILLARMAVRGVAEAILLLVRLLRVVLVIRHQLRHHKEAMEALVHQLIFMALGVVVVLALLEETLLLMVAQVGMELHLL